MSFASSAAARAKSRVPFVPSQSSERTTSQELRDQMVAGEEPGQVVRIPRVPEPANHGEQVLLGSAMVERVHDVKHAQRAVAVGRLIAGGVEPVACGRCQACSPLWLLHGQWHCFLGERPIFSFDAQDTTTLLGRGDAAVLRAARGGVAHEVADRFVGTGLLRDRRPADGHLGAQTDTRAKAPGLGDSHVGLGRRLGAGLEHRDDAIGRPQTASDRRTAELHGEAADQAA